MHLKGKLSALVWLKYYFNFMLEHTCLELFLILVPFISSCTSTPFGESVLHTIQEILEIINSPVQYLDSPVADNQN